MSWVYVFLGFSALIILHEAGHFVAAKATGMRVERFFLFFGPKLASVKRGETEYGIATIPAGGYVKISGMNPDDKLPPGAEHRRPGGQHRACLRHPLPGLLPRWPARDPDGRRNRIRHARREDPEERRQDRRR
jgi:membrane-associated protease RseP (regulator of RpoE activity)